MRKKKQVIQTVNQMLIKRARGSPTSNVDSSDTLHDNTPDRQSASALNTSDFHKHTTTSPKHTGQTHLKTCSHTPSQILKKKNKSLWT